MHAYNYVCVCMRECVCMYVCMHVHVCAYIYPITCDVPIHGWLQLLLRLQAPIKELRSVQKDISSHVNVVIT